MTNRYMKMTLKSRYDDIIPYTTKDGSTVRELCHPDHHSAKAQSLAEAIVPVGGETAPHRHPKAEEIYHITAGQGEMILGREHFAVEPGDTVPISPGAAHQIRNTGHVPLKILCCCSPPYSHEDTQLIDI